MRYKIKIIETGPYTTDRDVFELTTDINPETIDSIIKDILLQIQTELPEREKES